MVFRIRGEGLVEGLQVGGLPDGTVDQDTLAAGVPSSIATSALPSGTILQVVQATLDDAQESTASSTFVNTSLSGVITPSATSSKILVITNSFYMNSSSDVNGKLGIRRGSTVLNNDRALAVYYFQASSNVDPWNTGSMMFLDSPATTSETCYTVVFKCSGGTFYHGHGSGTGGSTQTITLMEVAG